MTKRIHSEILKRALQDLTSIGAKYRVVDRAGNVYPNSDPIAPAGRKYKDGIRRNRVVKTGTYAGIYVPALIDLKPGETGRVRVPVAYDLNHFRASASSWATRAWGPGGYKSTVSGRTIRYVRGS